MILYQNLGGELCGFHRLPFWAGTDHFSGARDFYGMGSDFLRYEEQTS